MTKCEACTYFHREALRTSDGKDTVKGPDGQEVVPEIGQCRRFPPQLGIAPIAAFHGVITNSPLEPGIPGWQVVCSTGGLFVPVKPDWGCGEGKERL